VVGSPTLASPLTRRGHSLGFSYEGGEPELLARIVPLVNYLEITPDTIARPNGAELHLDRAIVDELKAIAGEVRFVVHGVGLSIGSARGYSTGYLQLLDEFLSHFTVAWHSEHLGYTTVDGASLGTMLPLPRTRDVLSLVVRRINEIQTRFPLPFLIENIVHLLPDYPGDFSEALFLNTLVAETGCGLLLDIYNLECDAANYGFDIEGFLTNLDMGAVREIHIAGGVEFDGLRVDVHSRQTAPSTLALVRQVLERAPNVVGVTYELLPEAVSVLGIDTIVSELVRIRGALSR
jgi:uncharacterized protein